MRIIACFTKPDSVRFVSHLDTQRLFQRAFRRAGLPLAYSQGFNPHPLLSFATALSCGYTSDGEYFDVILSEPVEPEAFVTRVNAVLPEGMRIVSAVEWLLAGDIVVDKKTKGGVKPVDIRPQLISIRLRAFDGMRAEFDITGRLTAEGGLPLELLFKALYSRLGVSALSFVHRKKIEMDWSMLK